jgi:hypothetical protein
MTEIAKDIVGFLEGTNRVCSRKLDGKNVVEIITMDETVEFHI